MLNKVKEKITFQIVDIWFLIAILLILNVSTSMKIIGLLILVIYKPAIFKNFKSKEYPLFYILMIGVVLLQTTISLFDFDMKILKINLISLIIWGISLLTIIQINKIVSDTEFKKIQNTVILLFLINALVSGIEIIKIMIEIGSVNPYTYHGMVLNQMTGMSMYGAATGDYIGGIFGPHSLHNAFFNLFGIVYFLLNRKYIISIICLVILLMTTSNLVVIILLFMLFNIVLFHSSVPVKYMVLVYILIVSVFYIKVSPDNLEYTERMITQTEKKDIDNKILKNIKSKKEEEIKNQKIAKYKASRVDSNTKLRKQLDEQKINNNQLIINDSIRDNNPHSERKKKLETPNLSIPDTLSKIDHPTPKIVVVKNDNVPRNLNSIIIANNEESIVRELEEKDENFNSLLMDFGVDESVSESNKDNQIVLNDQIDNTSTLAVKKMEEFEINLKAHHTNLRNKVIDIYKDSLNVFPPKKLQQYPGKVISYIETYQYFTSSVKRLLLGSGSGQFSSKLAFGISGFSVNEGGGKRFLNRQVDYISDEFKENHLKLFSYYWLKDPGEHSISSEPFSSYNQIVGEYGIVGTLCFIGFYLLFFIKRYRKLVVGRYLLVLMMLMLLTDYWFEHLNVIIIFELLMFLDLKRNKLCSTNQI